MIPSLIIIGVGLVFLTLFLIEKCRRYSLKETLLKTTASILFIALAVVCNYIVKDHIFPVFAIIALSFGMLGDIFLDLKYVFKQEDKVFSYAGFICFAIGHILYITGMHLEFFDGSNVLYVILPLVFGLLMAFTTILLEKPLKLKYGSMKAICFIYAFFLFSMFGTAMSLLILHQFKSVALIMLSAGGMLFAVSDLILSGTYFGEGKERPVDIVTNGVLYYLAQYTIAFSIFFIATVI